MIMTACNAVQMSNVGFICFWLFFCKCLLFASLLGFIGLQIQYRCLFHLSFACVACRLRFLVLLLFSQFSLVFVCCIGWIDNHEWLLLLLGLALCFPC